MRIQDSEKVLFEAGGQLTCGDPESTYELTTPISGLTFARPGAYVIEALADGVAFARRELRVIANVPATVYRAAGTAGVLRPPTSWRVWE